MRPNVPVISQERERACSCRAHQLHRFFKYRWEHPSATLVQASKGLNISYNSAKLLSSRLRKRKGINQICPMCFGEKLFQGVCQACGFEPTLPRLPEVNFDRQSPTNSLQRNNELGAGADLFGGSDFTGKRVSMHFENWPGIISRKMEQHSEDTLIRNCKSDLLEWLKAFFPKPEVSDFCGKLVVKDVLELRARFPLLEGSKNCRAQVVENVKARMKLAYPFLEMRTAPRDSVKVLTP